MDEAIVGIRELKSRLSEYLRRVKAGETITITDRGQPVGRIVPTSQPLEQRIGAMVDAGLACWDGRALPHIAPPAQTESGHSVAEIIVQDREAPWTGDDGAVPERRQ